jgi:hypothetical protein
MWRIGTTAASKAGTINWDILSGEKEKKRLQRRGSSLFIGQGGSLRLSFSKGRVSEM